MSSQDHPPQQQQQQQAPAPAPARAAAAAPALTATVETAFVKNVLDKWRAAVPEEMSTWSFPAALTTAMCIASLPKSATKMPGLPPYLQLVGFTSMFALSTWAVHQSSDKDKVNGPSTATAWSIMYLVTNLRRGIMSRQTIPLAILASTSMQLGIYGITAAESFYYGAKVDEVDA
ncbi:hypothetical protein AMAG_02071 [Allomyces macrogynus ATCC 38327]|uniref:Uncharacterized protein n=1 Tax=Allomyces macrogynus (strain ATCC 38327) TaxID=578462 RepID=A0A0L0S112_ALLM3|nr:hypothetical protein AMAG_02071 [Allomyces macrogynus ATCC 38327]|eukprot:KNE56238.1 hypothetical protein AMAG_02071 [Allomyces macrogynus ATCC 38327]